jgi:hypothetical protein
VSDFVVSAMINEIDLFGHTVMSFNTMMKTEYINTSHINSTNVDIYVEPSNDWHLWDDTFDANSTLNLTWVVDKYEAKQMDINVTFLNPLWISSKIDQDRLIIHVRDPMFFFISAEHLVDLHQDKRTMSINLPK